MGRSRSRDRDKDGSNSRRGGRRSSSSSGSSGSSSSSRSSSSRSRSSSKDRDRNHEPRSRDPRDRSRRYSGGSGHRPSQAPRLNRRGVDRNNRPYSPKSKRQAEHRPGYPGDPSGWYAQPYGPHPPPGNDGHGMPPFQNFYNSEQGYPPDYQGQFGADYAYAGYDAAYYGAPPDFQAPPPHDYGMPGQGGNWDGNNIVYPDVSVPPPPAPVIPPSGAPQGPDMVPPPPATHAPEPYDEAKKEAVEQELVRQNRSLAMQRDEYVKKKASLNRELSRLKDQKRELVNENSKDNERILRENAKLQSEILQKLKSIDNVIEMFSSIIGDNAAAESKKENSRSETKKSEKAEKRKRSASPRSETPKKKSAPSPPAKKVIPELDKGKSTSESGKVNIIHYDPEMHWCSACEEFPRTLNDYLMHLHSREHKANMAVLKDDKPWTKDETRELTPLYIKDAMNKRVPLRGVQFLVPSDAWYCSMCKTWLGDIDIANKHLKSSVHTNSYNEFISQNPHWEVDWLTERTRAYERRSETKRFKTKTESLETGSGAGSQKDLSFGNLSDQIIAMLNSRKSDAKGDSSSSDSSSDSDSERRSRREKKSKKKKSKKKKKEKDSKKDKSRSPKRDREVVEKTTVVERPPPVDEIKPPVLEPPKPVAEPPRFHDMNFTPAFHPEMKYKFNSKGVFEETKMIWEEPKPIPKPIEPPIPVPAPIVAPPAPAKDNKDKRASPSSKSKKDKYGDNDDDDRRSRRSPRDRERSYDRRHDYRRYDRDRDRRDPRDRDRDRDRGGRDAFSSRDYYGPKEPPKKGGRGRDRKSPERDKNDKSKRLYFPGMEDEEEIVETAFEKRTSESAAKKKDEKKKTSFIIPKTRLPFIGRMPILMKKVDQKDESQPSGDLKEKNDDGQTVNSGSTLELMNEMNVEGEESKQSGGEENNADDTSGDEDAPVIKPTVMIGKRRNYKNRAEDNLMEQDMDIEEELAGKEEPKEHNAELHRDFKEALDLLFPEKIDGKTPDDKKIPEVPKVTTQITTSAPPQPYPVYDMSMYTDPATAAAYSMYYDPSVYVQQYMAMGYDQASAIQAVQAAYGVDPSLYMQQQAATMTAVVTPAPLPPPEAIAPTIETVVATEKPPELPEAIPTPVQTEVKPPEEGDDEATAETSPQSKPKRKNPLSQRMRRHLKKKADKEAAEKANADDLSDQEEEEGNKENEGVEIEETVENENGTVTAGDEEEIQLPSEVVEQPEENRNVTKEDSEPAPDTVKKPLKVEEMSDLALLGIEEDDITAQSFF